VDVRLVITLSLGLVALMWILKSGNGQNASILLTTAGNFFAKISKPLFPGT
jgi:hypothetical protein